MFKAILNFFRKLFSAATADALDKVLKEAAPFVALALPIVATVAKATPNRTDDEILAVIEAYGLDKALLTDHPATALRDVAVSILKTKITNPVATSVLNMAVELALQTFRRTA